MTKLTPFYTDDKTAKSILAAAKDYKVQAQDGRVTGAGASDVTTQFQNTCQFKLVTGWKKRSAKNFIASGWKIVPLKSGAERRSFPTTIFAYGERPTTGKDSIVVATRRANRWVLLPTGNAGASDSSNQKVRLVQPKELFPACEYYNKANVYGCTLEYSDTGNENDWTVAYEFDIEGNDELLLPFPDPTLTPHQYWRVNLKGTANEDPDNPGFHSYGRLWEAMFWIDNETEPKYVLSQDDTVESLPFDSKPLVRKSLNHRYWTLTFDKPEVVTNVMLKVDLHVEDYIVCPGGRDVNKQDVSFIYSFDLAAEKWTATTFHELQKPMFNMDAKVIELSDGTHQLVILSGLTAKGMSNTIQGYNFERDYILSPVNLGDELGLNFAGRPALVGDPMLRDGSGTSVSKFEGESDFSRSLMVVGGSEQSCAFSAGSTNNIYGSVLFSVRGSNLEVGTPYRIETQATGMSAIGHTGLPFGRFEYKNYSSNTTTPVTKLRNMAKYTRHQQLPVRGILRRRPVESTYPYPTLVKPVTDFLLIGGFCAVGSEEYNDRVISGFFNTLSWSAGQGINNPRRTLYTMAVPFLPQQYLDEDNFDLHWYYPPCGKVLGDCCAEYVEERDEVICFGGRATESDTAPAHINLAVLVFGQNNTAQWVYNKYPGMPHPRYSAASVLIKNFTRLQVVGEPSKDDGTACDRIFIIGGRNQYGLVPEVDVFNLRYNEWETEENGYRRWKGLDEGELETIPPSIGGGGGVTINIGGSSGVQSVKAGDGIKITGTSKNPVISAVLTGVYG